MRKITLWCIPGTFFLLACVLNWMGCIQGTDLADAVKPALLPLLCATSLAYLLGRDVVDYRAAGLLVAAQLFGCAGDVLLMPSSDVLFLIGMVAFLVGHLFYMTLFGRVSWQGLRPLQWLIAVVVMGALVTALVKCIGIQGELFVPMLVYGFALMLLIFSALAGVLRTPRGSRATWWILLAGALLFTFSDACIAMGMFGVMTFALRHFVVMFTYLAAQTQKLSFVIPSEAKESHSLFFVSMQIVTGPSLTRATCMSAPKVPVGTGLPSASDRAAQKRSYRGMATSGRAARM